jgi:hypothetical protein
MSTAADLHGLDGRLAAGGQHGDGIADLDRAGFDAAHEAAVVVQVRVGRILRAADVLHREAEFLGVFGVRGRGRFEDFQQGRALVPVQASPRSTIMSPFSADSGMKRMSSMPTLAANSR